MYAKDIHPNHPRRILMKTLNRNQICNFYVYKQSLERFQPDDPYAIKTSVNLGHVSDEDYAALRWMVEDLPRAGAGAPYKISSTDGFVLHAGPEAEKVLRKMEEMMLNVMNGNGLSAAQIKEFTCLTPRVFAGG
jgi:hypothetical protein